MKMFSRNVLMGFGAGWLLSTSIVRADESLGKLVIIDASVDVRPHIKVLKARGVEVIGRYFARCKQPEIKGVGTKRLIDNAPKDDKREVDAILDAGLGILSIYQYFSGSPVKFDGVGILKVTQSKDDVPEDAKPETYERTFLLPSDSCLKSAVTPNSAKQEAELDATAAVNQARAVGQPEGSAIYFGVDFDTAGASDALKQKLRTYFSTVREVLSVSKYRLGAYGDGGALELLSDLIDFQWISPSPAFNGTTAFYNKDNASRWHLFQSVVDAKWKIRSGTLELDGNVQSLESAGKDIGFWKREGAYIVGKERTKETFQKHRFVCNGSARVYRSHDEDPSGIVTGEVCAPLHFDVSRAVRVGKVEDGFVEVDCDDDGTFDGWTHTGSLSTSFATRPVYEKNQADRAKQVCK